MTFGEILRFPFSNAYVQDRFKRENEGEFMAMYSMSFSFAHILGSNIGMHMSDKYGFSSTFYLMEVLLLVACLLLVWLKRKVKEEGNGSR